MTADLPRYPAGSTIERRADGSEWIRTAPPIERYVVTLTFPACCPCCGRPLEPTATVEEELAI